VSRGLKVAGTVLALAASIAAIPVTGGASMAPWLAAAAVGANVAASLLQKRPPVQGALNEITIGSDQVGRYPMGRTYPPPALIHDVGYGGTVNDVPNPYRSWVLTLSSHGPIEQIEAVQGDFSTISFSSGAATGYFAGFLWLDSQLGATPEPDALAGPHGAIPQWGASYKLSGKPALLLTAKFDKKGKHWASGVPQWGAVVKGVLVYDPRQDSTYSGGSGACRPKQEGTYVGAAAALNPGCHGVTYALGRYQNGKRVFGVGLSFDQIDWPAWVDFMNTCDANAWTIGGTIIEPGSRWDNLKRICMAGGAKPVWSGGKLSVVFPRPRVALETIGLADLADGEIRIPAMKGWRDRINTVIPKQPSEAHRWELVAHDAVAGSTYVTEDGEEKAEEISYELVPNKDQGAELAAYDVANGREMGPIVIPVKPRLGAFKIGDALDVGDDLAAETGLAAGQLLVVTNRRRDPATMITELSFETETTAKHAFALGTTGTAPPSPTLVTPEELDEVANPKLDDALKDRGAYDPATTYSLNDLVQNQDTSWIYINAAASAGNAPPTLPDTLNDHWKAIDARAENASFMVQWSPDGTTSWGEFEAGDRYMRISTDGGATFGDAMLAIGESGAPGEAGEPGADGDIKQLVFKRAAATPSTPSGNGIPTGWADGPPAGTDPLWMSAAQQTAAGVLVGSWSAPVRIDGEDGADGANGAPGSNNAPVLLYKRSASAPTLPSTTSTYTFATMSLTGHNNGWTQSIPAGSDPLYVTSAVASAAGATDTIAASEWASPVILAQNGADGASGLNSATVFLYQRAASPPSVPSSTLTYTFATGVLSGTLGSWSQTIPAGTDPIYVTTAAALSTSATDTIATGEWAAVRVLAQNGAAGAPGTNGVDGVDGEDGKWIEFVWKRNATQPSTPTGNGIPTGWSDDPPAGSDPLWMSKAKQELNGTLVTGETWSTPIRHDGPPGATGATGAPGTNGVDGVDGEDGKWVEFVWKRNATQPSTPTGNGIPTGWSDDPPAGSDPLWMSKAKQELDGTLVSGEAWSTPIRHDGPPGATGATGSTGPQGPAGPQGDSLYTWIAYANNATGTSGFTTGAWTNQTYIGIANNKTSATESTNPADYTWSKIQGDQGVPGTPGADGQPTYTWFAYASNATGTANFTTGTPTSIHTYVGIAANKTTATESTNPADYTWSLMQPATPAPSVIEDAFLYANAAQLTERWNSDLGNTGDISSITDNTVIGGKAIRVGDVSGNDTRWLIANESIPFDPEALYEYVAIIRRHVVDAPAYLGVVGRNADKTAYVNVAGGNSGDSAHTVALDGVQPTLSHWRSYYGYIRGKAASGVNGDGSRKEDPLNPGKMHVNVANISPMVGVNCFNKAAQSDVAYVRLRRLEALPKWRAVGDGIVLLDDNAKLFHTTAWSGSVYSTLPSTNGAAAGCVVPTATTTAMIGLTTESSPAAGSGISFGVYFKGAGSVSLYGGGGTAGVETNNGITTYAAGDRFEVVWDGSRVRYLKGGTEFHSVEVALTSVRGKANFGASAALANLTFTGNGVAGEPGDDGLTVSPPAQLFGVAASANGTVKSGEMPKTFTFVVTQGGVDLSNDADTDYIWSNPAGVTASMGGTNGKVFTATAMTASTTVTGTVTVQREGVTVAVVQVTFVKTKDGFGAAPMSDDTLTINNTSSYSGTQGGTITRTVGTEGVNITVNHPYSASGSAGTLAGKVQYRTTPGSGAWSDIGSEVVSLGASPSEPDVLSISETLAGPATPANWEFQYINRRSSGSGTLATNGTDDVMTVEGIGS
jgi:hypothetical protein